MPVLSRKKRVALLVLAFAALVLIAQSAYRTLSRQKEEGARQEESAGPLDHGMAMPSGITLEELGGKKVSLSDYKGKVVLINFWAGWCGPCLHEMPGLFALSKSLESRGFVVLGLNMDDDPQSGLNVLKKVAGEAPFPMFRGANSALADRFTIEGLPFTVVLDKNFNIAYAQPGEVDWNGPRAKALIEGLL
jgi:thiol-disulfide isomerase/thioredoxin